MDWTDLRKHWEESDRKEKSDRESEGNEIMKEIHRATTILRNSGWRDACYCPKDGTMFWAWSPTMSMPYRCNYQGDWPNGKWWAYMSGDVWPDNPGPVLFKEIEKLI